MYLPRRSVTSLLLTPSSRPHALRAPPVIVRSVRSSRAHGTARGAPHDTDMRGPVLVHREVGSREAPDMDGIWASRCGGDGTLANHVNGHVTPTYKAMPASTQPDPSRFHLPPTFPLHPRRDRIDAGGRPRVDCPLPGLIRGKILTPSRTHPAAAAVLVAAGSRRRRRRRSRPRSRR